MFSVITGRNQEDEIRFGIEYENIFNIPQSRDNLRMEKANIDRSIFQLHTKPLSSKDVYQITVISDIGAR